MALTKATTSSKSRVRPGGSGQSKRRSQSTPLAPRHHFSTLTLLIVAFVLAVVGVSFVLFSQAGTIPYSRLDCTAKKGYMGVVGPTANPPIPGYTSRASKQACVDRSTEAMVAKLYKVVTGNNIQANIPYYQQQANAYVVLRSAPPVEFTTKLLAADKGLSSLSNDKTIDTVYQRVMGRTPDAKGRAYWLQYLKTNGKARLIPAFLASPEALRKIQPVSNAAIAALPASWRPNGPSKCGNGLTTAECLNFVKRVQQGRNVPCKGYNKGGSVVPLCKPNTPGGVDDTVYAPNIAGTNVTLNIALAPKFASMHKAALKVGLDVRAGDIEGPRYGSFRTSAMQQRLLDRGLPAAPLGTSMHQWGLAIDFGCGGKSWSNSGAKCQNWIKANAGKYGLKNLPSEPWHYSTNGR